MTLSDKTVVAAFVALLVIGSVTAYLLVFEEVNGDPREESHEYSFEGTLYGEPCTGTGRTAFIEHSGGFMLHSLTYSVATDAASIEKSIDLIFDEDGNLDDSYRNTGTATVNGETVNVWEYASDGIGYMLCIGEDCTLLRITAESPDLELTGHIDRNGGD